MRVAIFGGTGFVGSYLIDALINKGHHPVVLVRPSHESRVMHKEDCTLISGDIEDEAAISSAIRGADAVIYNIGILREYPSKNITFQGLQSDAPCKVIRVAKEMNVSRFLLMSANGVTADGTPYQRTKHEAEECLKDSTLDWTIFQPSVIFGDPRGRMEFATQLAQEMVIPPLPAPLFYTGLLPVGAGQFQLSPVHVQDVAKAFVYALEHNSTYGQVIELGGDQALTWKEIIQQIASVLGKKKLMLPAPACAISAVARIMQGFESFPVTSDQISMLMEGNTCSSTQLHEMGITPASFNDETLAYLKPSASSQ